MDERNKIIRDLEEKRKQDLAASDETLEKLGRKLLAGLEGRAPGGPSLKAGGPDAELVAYLRAIADIAENEGQIKAVEAESADYQELVGNIENKEKDYSKDYKELSSLYTQTGRLVLADPSFEAFSAMYETETEELTANIEVREARLEELEQKAGNFFSQIGKSAEGLVVKTLLLKNQADLQKIYRSAGEKFIVSAENYEDGDDELKNAASGAGKLKASLEEMASDLALLKEERKKTADRFRGDGNPDRRIKALEKQIAKDKEEISKISRRFGGFVLDKEHSDYFKSLLDEDDSKEVARAEALLASVEESSVRIGKLKAAVAIDGEKSGIERLKKSIDSENRKIKAAEEAIDSMEKDIQAAEDRIEELKKLL